MLSKVPILVTDEEGSPRPLTIHWPAYNALRRRRVYFSETLIFTPWKV